MSRSSPRLPADRRIARAVELLASLANGMRLKVLIALNDGGPMSAGALQALVGAEQSALSHQLAALRRARLVSAQRSGRQMIYSLVDDHVGHIVADALVHANERRNDGRRPRT